ncbi:MAG: sce7726 family protein [Ignavibacteriae bacterium]|nr:sce7726 family protein [Ignavibacteriota bacterium]
MKDFEIRKALRDTSLKKFISDPNSKVVDELNIPITKSRIDIAVVNGHLHGFEIKSAKDTLVRLPHQIEGYTKVFDYLTVITEDKHYKKIQEILPEWVGLKICIESSTGYKLKTIQKGSFNRNKEGFYLAKLLWRDEVETILKEQEIKFAKKNTLWKLCEILGDNVPITKLSEIVRKTLKSREDWKIKEYYA